MTSRYNLPPRGYVTPEDKTAAHQRAADLGAELAHLIATRNKNMWQLQNLIDIDADPEISELRQKLWHATWYALTLDPDEKYLPKWIQDRREWSE